jgi:hypothetical protein
VGRAPFRGPPHGPTSGDRYALAGSANTSSGGTTGSHGFFL